MEWAVFDETDNDNDAVRTATLNNKKTPVRMTTAKPPTPYPTQGMARVPSAGFPGSGKRKVFGSGPVSRFFTTMRAFLTGLAVLFIAVLAAGAFLAWRWVETWTATASPLAPSGGLYFPGTVLNDVPHFAQADPRWTTNLLGPTPGTLGAEGCAVASAAMVLAGYGAKVDPGSLNKFLQGNGGYTGNGWLYWEKAAEVPPGLAEHIYEADASHFLIDWNLLRGNPVIVRLRYPGGLTHFVVIVGKQGCEYLIRDPGGRYKDGLYFLSEFGSPIEALRFFRRNATPAVISG